MNSVVADDIQEIIDKRPELSQEEWETVSKASDWLKAQLKPEVRLELLADFDKQHAEEMEKIRAENKSAIEREMSEWKKSQEPLSKDELHKLLNQEYITFPVTLQIGKEKKVREFTLVELPQEAETKFIKSMQTHLIPLLETFNAQQFRLSENYTETMTQALQRFPQALQASAEIAAVCLNPWGDDKEIDGAWIAKHLSTVRIAHIIAAQAEVNHYRDFFSSGFRIFRT